MENRTHSKQPGGPKHPNHHVDNRAEDTYPRDSRRCEQTDKTLPVNSGAPQSHGTAVGHRGTAVRHGATDGQTGSLTSLVGT